MHLKSPEYVRPYVKAQKNDDHDAEGITEATTRLAMWFVELRNEAQPCPVCVIDRVVQQALVEKMTPMLEPLFADCSFGYGPRRLPQPKLQDRE